MKIPKILFENEHILLVDKDYGVVVHPGSGIEMADTLCGELLKAYPDLPISNGEDRPGIVHRLDKDTSGVLLIAKTEEALAYYLDQWKSRKVEKVYTALISGLIEPETGTIEAPVSRDLKYRNKMSAMNNSGKMAVTHYEVVKYFPSLEFPSTLVKVKIETGRTHQIRVHFAAIGFPVVGDSMYGNRRVNQYFQDVYGLERQFLHASELEFSLMDARKKERVISDLPADLEGALKRMSEIARGELG